MSEVGNRTATKALRATADAADVGPTGESIDDVDASGVHDAAGDDHEEVPGETDERDGDDDAERTE